MINRQVNIGDGGDWCDSESPLCQMEFLSTKNELDEDLFSICGAFRFFSLMNAMIVSECEVWCSRVLWSDQGSCKNGKNCNSFKLSVLGSKSSCVAWAMVTTPDPMLIDVRITHDIPCPSYVLIKYFISLFRISRRDERLQRQRGHQFRVRGDHPN